MALETGGAAFPDPDEREADSTAKKRNGESRRSVAAETLSRCRRRVFLWRCVSVVGSLGGGGEEVCQTAFESNSFCRFSISKRSPYCSKIRPLLLYLLFARVRLASAHCTATGIEPASGIAFTQTTPPSLEMSAQTPSDVTENQVRKKHSSCPLPLLQKSRSHAALMDTFRQTHSSHQYSRIPIAALFI